MKMALLITDSMAKTDLISQFLTLKYAFITPLTEDNHYLVFIDMYSKLWQGTRHCNTGPLGVRCVDQPPENNIHNMSC